MNSKNLLDQEICSLQARRKLPKGNKAYGKTINDHYIVIRMTELPSEGYSPMMKFTEMCDQGQ